MGKFEEKEKSTFFDELEQKKKKHTLSERLKIYWQKLFHSTKKKMSRGAQNVNKIITWARGDNWRRK